MPRYKMLVFTNPAKGGSEENYNKWYVIEKACALGSDRLAAIGFRELDPMDAAEILRDLPYLPTASHD